MLFQRARRRDIQDLQTGRDRIAAVEIVRRHPHPGDVIDDLRLTARSAAELDRLRQLGIGNDFGDVEIDSPGRQHRAKGELDLSP
jgi:hypothetical protein